MAKTAVVIGSGPNGLAAAITMAQAGWQVTVHEAEATIGGGVRSAELTLPGFVHDVCSAIHPLGRDSPFFKRLELGVEWVQPPAPAAHPLDDGTAVMLERSVAATGDQLEADAEAYRRLVGPMLSAWPHLESIVIGPLPPPARRFASAIRPRLARNGLSSARSLAERTFATERARALVAGHAAHSMLPLERRPSGGIGLFFLVVAHAYGWPFPRGGAQRLTEALVELLQELGGEIRTESLVEDLPKADAVLADVVPRGLLGIAGDRLPTRYAESLRSYRYGPGAFKLDWALDGPIPWRAEECRRAGTVHIGGTFDEIAASEQAAWADRHSDRPYVLLTQPSLFDDSRAPAGKHTAWAYCHVPNGSTHDMSDAIESQIERFAPGFRELVLARSATAPAEFERRNRNIVGGDINGGAMDLGQLLFRPARRVVPYRTPLRGLYICSSATPPGGGVHGMCGHSAARVALRDLG